MNKKILIVEDEFIVAKDLSILLKCSGYQVFGIAKSVAEALDLMIDQEPDLVLLDIQLKGKLTGIDLAHQLLERNIAFVYLSSNSNQTVLEAAKATQPDGFIVKPFREKDVLIALEIAHYRHEHSIEPNVHRSQRQQQRTLTQYMAEPIGWEQKMLKSIQAFLPGIPFDFLTVGLEQPDGATSCNICFLQIGFEEYQTLGNNQLSTITGIKVAELMEMKSTFSVPKMIVRYVEEDFNEICQCQPFKKMVGSTFGVESNLMMPLSLANGELFVLSFYSRKSDAYSTEHAIYLNYSQPSFTTAVETLLAEKTDGPQKLPRQLSRIVTESVETTPVEGIIGSSHYLLNVLDQIRQVAPYDTSVLILGESGTGKEKIAQVIHQLSPRKEKPLVVVNCAALPANLIESELFGHERGAFTGAINQRIGKFEMANEGTIFLDEISELPVELQVKLLRVLQEKTIERVGGKATINVNVRILAASNRNLEKEIAEGHFRLDLYYRINVFPVMLPPLRERKEDISLLAHHFAQQFCTRFSKSFHGISDAMIVELEAWQWPGNIRELENCIQQSVILNDGLSSLQLKRPLGNGALVDSINSFNYASPKTLSDVKSIQSQTEKEYLLSVLRDTKGRVRGQGGAAETLNVKPTTLESRMAKLGIKKENLS